MDELTIVDKTIVLVAKRGSGKSRLLRYIVDCESDRFDEIFVICPSESVNPFYKCLTDDDNIFEEYNDEWVGKLLQQMTKYNQSRPKHKRRHVLLILDDCISDVNFNTCKNFKKIFTRGRHVNITLIMTTQYMNAIPPITRTNTDYLMVGQLTAQGIELLCNEFHSGHITKKEFIKMYLDSTENYSFFVVNNNSVVNHDIENLYGTIKTPAKYL